MGRRIVCGGRKKPLCERLPTKSFERDTDTEENEMTDEARSESGGNLLVHVRT